ncbi:MAG: ABC transporter permease [Nitrospiraceae bacterium]|nr:ABC transporter permease [Nitrospiraceae bacterium]
MSMRPILVIGLNTFRENLRDKILYNLLLFAVMLMGASVLLADLTIMEHHKIIKDMGLAAINLGGVMIAVFVGIGLVSKEIERRTVFTIMARPISRAQFIVGKYFGLMITLSVNLAVMTAVFFMTLWLYRVPIQVSLFQAIELIFVELLLVTAIALFFSTFSSSTLSAIMTLGIYVSGHLTADMKGIAEKSQNELSTWFMTAWYYLCPNLEAFNIKGQAATGIPISWNYQVLATGYGLIYASLLVVSACAIFRRRDF